MPRVAGALLAAVALVGMVWLGSRLVKGRSVDAPLPPEPAVTSQLGRSVVDSSLSPEQTSAGSHQLRYATTWVSVRETRSRHSSVAWVLDPGEAVLVDSLIAGWYRVVVDGQVLGYAARSYLDPSPPNTER